MATLAIFIFITGYIAISLEHPLGINKAATAVLTGVLCWTLYIFQVDNPETGVESLMHHLGEISSILFFLLGAMTIVELIDSHEGFKLITQRIKTRSKARLLWIISILTFFLSALLDNLTTAIVMTSLVCKILDDRNDKLYFSGMVIIAANAGGAFSPLGDVTTTMLWIGNQISAGNIILKLFLPSVAVCLIPLLLVGRRFANQTLPPKSHHQVIHHPSESKLVLILGVLLLLFVPVFKLITHLPPFMGILFALGVLWIVTSYIHRNKQHEHRNHLSVVHALQKIDSPSILFFLGILLAVAGLESFGLLTELADKLSSAIHNEQIIVVTLGVISAIVDNVPLVAAAQGMYSLTNYPTDHDFWTLLALTTGTGGSMIIIGSAAGVAAMGIAKIEFMWYFRRIAWIAFLGFLSGVGAFILQETIF
ncbi:MAG TPA: sodium:proton antiporter NhaD [Saprospiraceae bacterium]|nr:sodium:proton antiporter NhaD [Saprospiraceae bacterium]